MTISIENLLFYHCFCIIKCKMFIAKRSQILPGLQDSLCTTLLVTGIDGWNISFLSGIIVSAGIHVIPTHIVKWYYQHCPICQKCMLCSLPKLVILTTPQWPFNTKSSAVTASNELLPFTVQQNELLFHAANTNEQQAY